MQDPLVDAVRAFNRFYTRHIGVLDEGHLHSPFSLAEVRILYELAHRDGPVAADLCRDLGLDPGYLSRILLKFRKNSLLTRKPSPEDARQSRLFLTPAGRKTFGPLGRSAAREVARMIEPLSAADRERLVSAMRTIERLLGKPAAEPYTLRPHQSGDMGWVIHRHGALYAREYGYDQRFEALVAEIAAHFLRNFDPARERCWIAERGGEIVGSVFLVKQSAEIAKLRMLLVEPSARGIGLGRRLVEECVAFARHAGYRSVTLWTQASLDAARHIYQNAGFRLVHEEPHEDFGLRQTSQTWDLTL
jgi:DNA-binding MarR family transcriptional regulator/N-acetylglutamate synthase-like GNAT family acetyltransferase